MMRRAPALLAMLALVAGCGEREDEEQPPAATQAAAPSTSVNASPPAVPRLALDALGMADVEKYDLYGVGCVFQPQGAGKDEWTVITGDDDAHVKRAGVLVRLVAEPGAPEIAWLAVTRYATQSLRLEVAPGPGQARITGEESSEQQATVTLRDTASGALYSAKGALSCGA